ncbi:aspartyl protease family protein [Sphingomonas colocasiae]|uniref:Aspartyl protease family protein n=1 Tax=Sphingomonas colocasiae TaxID=1848973 RepID=A0ABS7PMJ7_9SPHN|nr:aspartyl protease family protein [Sphingomonas colocasiae]MBY8822535.1 aspartyl protease family protein [Sphingomonas colocasiae]
MIAGLFPPSQAIAGKTGCAPADWHDFDVDRDRHIRVPVTIAGIPFSAVLDSGATRSVIDRRIADRLGLTAQAGYTARGLTDDVEGAIGEAATVRIGDIALSLSMGVLDLGALSTASSRPIDVVLGREIFEQGIVDIDFRKERIRFLNRDCRPGDGRAIVLPLRNKDGMYSVTAAVEGRGDVDFLLDLGSTVSVYLSPSYALETKLLEGKKVSTGMTAGMEGLDLSLLSTLRSFNLAGVEFRNVPVAIPERWSQQTSGVIGLPVLARFRVQIDAAAGHIRLTPDGDTHREPFARDRSGLSTSREDRHLRVLHVARGSPAERAGMRANDRIVAINGVGVPKAYPPGAIPIGRRPAGTVVKLLTAEGGDHSITLEDYY